VSLFHHKKEELYSSKPGRYLLSILLQHHKPGKQILNNSGENKVIWQQLFTWLMYRGNSIMRINKTCTTHQTQLG
jgi:hypothetical protein